ncbi:Hypothetical protein PBC10988_28750 [Planctomycetales bacterium 10988]|nr:Hypothetical protein PBC10988_28750 [Planctomycetales bacterium 10988]
MPKPSASLPFQRGGIPAFLSFSSPIWRWAIFAIVIWGLVEVGSYRWTTAPAEGKQFAIVPREPKYQPLSATRQPVLRLATFNMHGAKGEDKVKSLARTAEFVKKFQPDFLALQEVHYNGWLERSNQAERLGWMLEYDWLFAPTSYRWGMLEFGNGVLSRYPVEQWLRRPLPVSSDRTPRNWVLSEIVFDSRRIRILSTHLDTYDGDSLKHMATAKAMFLELEPPAVLLGDLNARADHPQILALCNHPEVRFTKEEDQSPNGPDWKIDWIFLRGLQPVQAGWEKSVVSDHPLYWVDVTWPDPEQYEPSPNEESNGVQVGANPTSKQR